MTSDDSKRPGSGGFRQIGVGMVPTFLCSVCGKSKTTTGRRLRQVRGVKRWVCGGCVRG